MKSITLQNCTGLQYLNLANNNISGELPQEFGYMRELQAINLDSNNLMGEIPQN
jgi:Leucine-rich repeat (LRR) protein